MKTLWPKLLTEFLSAYLVYIQVKIRSEYLQNYIKQIDSIWQWVCTLIDLQKTSKRDKNNSDPLDCVSWRRATLVVLVTF